MSLNYVTCVASFRKEIEKAIRDFTKQLPGSYVKRLLFYTFQEMLRKIIKPYAPEGAYKRYLRLVRLLQERGIPVKPMPFSAFKDSLERAHFAGGCVDESARSEDDIVWSEHITKIDEKKAFFSAMAAQIVTAPYTTRIGGIYAIEKGHAADFLTALRPEDIPRAVGEVHKRALKDRFVKKQKAPPSEIDKIPELVEEATKVLEEHFKGDPMNAVHYILTSIFELFGISSKQELEKEYRDLLFRADKIFREWEEKRKRRALPAPPEAEFVGVRKPKPEEKVPVPEVKNVRELKELLRKYKEGLEKKGYPVSAHIVGVFLEHMERAPDKVVAVPGEVLDRALAHVVTAAKMYRALRDEGWYGKLLGAAKRVAMGDKRVLEKLRQRLMNLFPVPEEVHPKHPEEVKRAMEKIASVVTKPEVITSLAEKRDPYDYMLSMGKNERLYLGIAKEVERVKRAHGEIVPVREVSRIAGKLAPEVWRRVVKK